MSRLFAGGCEPVHTWPEKLRLDLRAGAQLRDFDRLCWRCLVAAVLALGRTAACPAEAAASEDWVLAKDCRRLSMAPVSVPTWSDSRLASFCCAASKCLTPCICSWSACS